MCHCQYVTTVWFLEELVLWLTLWFVISQCLPVSLKGDMNREMTICFLSCRLSTVWRFLSLYQTFLIIQRTFISTQMWYCLWQRQVCTSTSAMQLWCFDCDFLMGDSGICLCGLLKATIMEYEMLRVLPCCGRKNPFFQFSYSLWLCPWPATPSDAQLFFHLCQSSTQLFIFFVKCRQIAHSETMKWVMHELERASFEQYSYTLPA